MLFLEEMLFPRITACRCLMSICRINLPVEKGEKWRLFSPLLIVWVVARVFFVIIEL